MAKVSLKPIVTLGSDFTVVNSISELIIASKIGHIKPFVPIFIVSILFFVYG